ncbi:hypothetical protein ACJJJB_00305 (plasmid) [Microbulbifer sp. ANSA001]|uniref:hypothetical protein n=1 Tax=Microbulbifer sp. ANSA001 TaxID=3243358 RepID=UPI004042873C
MGLKIREVLRAAGSIAAPLISAHPAGAIALAAINGLLPGDKKLPQEATAQQAVARVKELPTEQQAQIYNQQIQLEMRESDNFAANVQAIAEVDKAGQSTRPYIAVLMAWYVVLIGLAMSAALCLAIHSGAEAVKALGELWPLVLALTALPAALLRAYFGLRTKEKNARYAASVGQPLPDLSVASTALRRLFST